MPSNDDGQEDDPLEVTSYMSGKQSFKKALALPFLKEAVLPLEADGFEEVDGTPDGFPARDRVDRTPVAFAGVDGAFVGIALFLSSGMGQWAIDKVCDVAFEKTIRPALRRLLRRRKEEGFDQETLRVAVGAGFKDDGLFVQVIATVKPGEGPKSIEKLVPEAFRQAAKWTEDHGVRRPALVYRIEDGKLSLEPTLAESVPLA